MGKIKIFFLVILLLAIAAGAYLHPRYSKYKNAFEAEDVTFTSHKEKLAGTLIMPKNSRATAVIVIVHGSGERKRNTGLARYFASEGIATLVYDKRGVGESGGDYVGPEGNASEKNLNLLADDAVAAIEYISQHHQLSSIPKGMVGISQAGWIIPLSAVKSDAVEFIGLWSGPVCKVSEEGIYSEFTGDSDSVENTTDFKIIQESMKGENSWPDSYGKDVDSLESLQLLSIPGLWVFGEKDGTIPVDLSISRLGTLIDQGKENYEFIVKEGLGHDSVIDPTLGVMADWIIRVSGSERRL